MKYNFDLLKIITISVIGTTFAASWYTKTDYFVDTNAFDGYFSILLLLFILNVLPSTFYRALFGIPKIIGSFGVSLVHNNKATIFMLISIFLLFFIAFLKINSVVRVDFYDFFLSFIGQHLDLTCTTFFELFGKNQNVDLLRAGLHISQVYEVFTIIFGSECVWSAYWTTDALLGANLISETFKLPPSFIQSFAIDTPWSILSSLNSFLFLDGVSAWLSWLVFTVGYVLSFSSSKKIKINNNVIYGRYTIYNNLMDVIVFLMLVCFVVKNIFIFFIAFEAILAPLFIYILLQGSRFNKIFAVKYLVVYTVLGSVFLWFSVSFILEIIGNSNYDYLQWAVMNNIDSETRKIIFLLLFLGFAIKVPMVPFHHWLTIAHVEAPTNGSIILAALLLKVGTYGLYRFVYSVFPVESSFFSSEISAIALFGFTYATILAVRQIDVKRYIAYTSIAHMNFSLLGLFSCTEIGVQGYVHTTISHGIIATAMFYLIGHLYSILHFRDTLRISGLSQKFPKFSIFFFLFSMANMGLPLFSGFVGEFYIITSLLFTNEIYAIVACFGFMLSGVYNVFQINRLLFSDCPSSILFKKNEDLDSVSVGVLFILLFWSLVFGVFPDIILKNVEIGLL